VGTLVGSIDDLLRPVVRIQQSGPDDEFLALLDTGFNGELFLSPGDATRFGFRLSGVVSLVRLAGGRTHRVQRGNGKIVWLGKTREIEALVSINADETIRADEPIALVGTRLLYPHILLIDFAAGTVEIEAQD
jgi:predicted aspartyl protease